MRDLYRVCLTDPRARSSYLAILSQYAEENFADRLKAIPNVSAYVNDLLRKKLVA